MRLIFNPICAVASIALLGCASMNDNSCSPVSFSDQSPVGSLFHGRRWISSDELAEVDTRVRHLDPGMSWGAVDDSLCLRQYVTFSEIWGAPGSMHAVYIFVKRNCSLDLEFDALPPSGRFVAATLNEEWPDRRQGWIHSGQHLHATGAAVNGGGGAEVE